MISLQSLHVTFNVGTPIENHVLRGLTLDVQEGEFVCVIGSNGAGKSTMLNAISGDLLVDTGRVVIGNKDVTRLPTSTRAPWVARVFQDPLAGTCESLTILENMALAMGRGQRRRPFMEAAKQSERELFRSKLRLTAQELSTILRYDLKPIIFLINNDGYTIERLILGETSSYNDVAGWRYAELPDVLAPNIRTRSVVVTDMQELEAALAAIDLKELTFIEVRFGQMDAPSGMPAFGRMARDYDYGPWARIQQA